jgi:cation transport ATPase
MFAAANFFRNATYGLEQQVEEQVKKVRAVRDATLNLSPDQQQAMVDNYNRANPKKKPVDLAGFIKTLNDEVKASEARLEQERRNIIGTQQRNLYASQFVQSLKILLGATAFFFLWKLTDWARPAGQMALGTELGAGRHRRG